MWQKHWIIWKHVSLLLETQNYIKHAGKTHEKQSILLLLKFKNCVYSYNIRHAWTLTHNEIIQDSLDGMGSSYEILGMLHE